MKKAIIVFLLCALLSILLGYMERKNPLLSEEGTLFRRESGQGDYETELMLKIEGIETESPFVVTVPQQRLTKEEEEALLEAAVIELNQLFPGENESIQRIQNRVKIQTNYKEGAVQAEWEFSNPWLIDEDGTIREEQLAQDGEQVMARVILTCEDSSFIHEFYFIVYKQKRTEEERIYEEITGCILEEGMAEGTEKLLLPKEVEGHKLVWSEKKSDIPLQILFLGALAAVLFPAVERQKEREKQKEREEELLREYPEMVNKLSLLLGAGMTLYLAWKKITEMYLNARKAGKIKQMAVYEEMLLARREIESGKGEIKAYAAFGERCGIQKYRKLSNYLIQNLKKGNSGMQAVLEREASEVFEERKGLAKRYSEEAGTKLLLPMLLMLGIVIFIIMVPAVLSFQSGL